MIALDDGSPLIRAEPPPPYAPLLVLVAGSAPRMTSNFIRSPPFTERYLLGGCFIAGGIREYFFYVERSLGKDPNPLKELGDQHDDQSFLIIVALAH